MIPADEYRALVREIAREQAQLSSAAWFFTGEDRLQLRTFGSLASVVVTMEGRMLDARGAIVPFAETHTPNSDRTVATTRHNVGEGFLLNVCLRASTGAPLAGQVFGILEVVRGLGTTVHLLGVLLQGEITAPQRLGWPGSPLRHSLDGPGIIRAILGTDPAAFTEVSETVPTGSRWHLHTLVVTLVADANAATRRPSLTFTNGGGSTRFRSSQAITTAANGTTRYHWAEGMALETGIGTTVALAGLPLNNRLEAGSVISTLTESFQATDNYGAPTYVVTEWLEGA